MPRISDETIERLKQEISLERLAEARGVRLARHGGKRGEQRRQIRRC